ncbi:hypothetical protein F4556_000385 [Kitasatospora gansuensis]|uniref:Uncharacterized protein n=1 Tax=Kitasatospora gansuensis TaxID=258050 RepID=A0A7W7WFR8_9ACTN|nr:hypothetical protein [Kitasatospora gansuensis]MBB4944850.1 hypothetical protein [Kitasatospora gansuensis]
MGFNGYLVLARTKEAVTDLLDLSAADEVQLHEPIDCPEGWRVLGLRPYPAEDLVDDGQVRRLAADTGAPVLVCQVFRSDYAEVRGCAPGGRVWSAEFNVRLVVEQAVLEEFGCTEDDGLSAEEWQECVDAVTARWDAERADALGHALSWAAAAGHEVSRDAVAEVVNGAESFAEAAVHELFRCLGVRVPVE